MDEHGYEVEIRENVWIPMRDGVALAANLYLPVAREPGERFPAILEMLPYRKDDWRYNSDRGRMGYLAARGFVGCRLDVRGTGSSPGLALDEYTTQETEDGYDVVEWLAAQPWCNGNVGMWGISYGGFTAIQVAMMQPPHLKAIAPMYATDDRYTDDVHYLGGCKTASELAQYAVSMVAMNALPPSVVAAGEAWAEQWQTRLAQTPPWLLNWLRQQQDGPYWRRGSLAPDYERVTCAIYHFAGWTDGYTNAALRMQEKCTAAPRKVLVGNWSHTFPDTGYPGPAVDWLHELVRFFNYWLKGEDDGIMDEPPVTLFRREFTQPKAFPAQMNGIWQSFDSFPVPGTVEKSVYLYDGRLVKEGGAARADSYPHRPTIGTAMGLSWGAGAPPTGLARDLRAEDALCLTFTSEPLSEPLDIAGFPTALLYLSSTAPVAHVAVRLSDVAPDGTSALVTAGILNLTHREGHADPQPLTPDEIYSVRVVLKATSYRFLPGHRLRLSLASACWPIIFPSPYLAENTLHQGGNTPSRLLLPMVPEAALQREVPDFKTTPAAVAEVGAYAEEPPVWEITEDVINQRVCVTLRGADRSTMPDGTSLFTSERIELIAHRDDPAHAQLYNECVYRLQEKGYETEVQAGGTIQATAENFHVDIELEVLLNGRRFWQKSWLETIPRQLL